MAGIQLLLQFLQLLLQVWPTCLPTAFFCRNNLQTFFKNEAPSKDMAN